MPETNIKYWMSTIIEKIRFFKKKKRKRTWAKIQRRKLVSYVV